MKNGIQVLIIWSNEAFWHYLEGMMMSVFSLALILSAVVYLPAQSDGGILASLDIKTSKESLRPGETMLVTLTNFKDPKGLPLDLPGMERVVVVPNSGVILDGISASVPNDPRALQKAFISDEQGVIEFTYRAPLHCKNDHVVLSIFNSLSYGRSDELPLEDTEPHSVIATLNIPLTCGTYLLLEYEEEYRRQTTHQSKSHRIHAVLRLDCKPYIADNMVQVTNLDILEVKGSAQLISKSERLSSRADSADLGPYNTLLLFVLNAEDEEITGLLYEAVPLTIHWRGDEIAEGPPNKVKVGPVSVFKPDKEEVKRKGKDLAHDFPVEDKNARRVRRMQQSLLQQFGASQMHPDHRVLSGNGVSFFSGQGRWEKNYTDGHYVKTYHWELVLNDT